MPFSAVKPVLTSSIVPALYAEEIIWLPSAAWLPSAVDPASGTGAML